MLISSEVKIASSYRSVCRSWERSPYLVITGASGCKFLTRTQALYKRKTMFADSEKRSNRINPRAL